MFKKKGSKKQIRKLKSIIDSDSDEITEPKPERSLGVKKAKISLSFGDNEGEGEGELEEDVNSKQPTKKKKMKQAPQVAPDLYSQEDNSGENTLHQSYYNSDALADLKKNQQVKKAETRDSLDHYEDGMVIDGDLAEKVQAHLSHAHAAQSDDVDDTPAIHMNHLTDIHTTPITPKTNLINIEEILKLLNNTENEYNEKEQEIKLRYTSIQGQLNSYQNDIKNIKFNLQPYLNKFNNLNKLNIYITTLIYFLREKIINIQQLNENWLYNIVYIKYQLHHEKRIASIEDDFLIVLYQISESSSNQLILEWAGAGSDLDGCNEYRPTASLMFQVAVEVELDAFGRNILHQNDNKFTGTSKEAVLNRKEKRKKRVTLPYKVDDISGLDGGSSSDMNWNASDDETDSEGESNGNGNHEGTINYKKHVLSSALEVLFEDTQEQYTSVSSVLSELGPLFNECGRNTSIRNEKREKGEEEDEDEDEDEGYYHQMYMSLSLPQLLTSLIQIEFLNKAFNRKQTAFDSCDGYEWHQAILDYTKTKTKYKGKHHSSDLDVDVDVNVDVDGDATLMLRTLMEAYIPWLMSNVQHLHLDPLNSVQNDVLISSIKYLQRLSNYNNDNSNENENENENNNYDSHNHNNEIQKKMNSSINKLLLLVITKVYTDCLFNETAQLGLMPLLALSKITTTDAVAMEVEDSNQVSSIMQNSTNSKSESKSKNVDDINIYQFIAPKDLSPYLKLITSQFRKLCLVLVNLYKYCNLTISKKLNNNSASYVYVDARTRTGTGTTGCGVYSAIESLIKRIVSSKAITKCMKIVVSLILKLEKHSANANVNIDLEDYSQALYAVHRFYSILSVYPFTCLNMKPPYADKAMFKGRGGSAKNLKELITTSKNLLQHVEKMISTCSDSYSSK
jgi:hypothetical protein